MKPPWPSANEVITVTVRLAVQIAKLLETNYRENGQLVPVLCVCVWLGTVR
jgi:hypothetical protein